MAICNSIVYFTLVLSALLSLVLHDPLHVWILQVLSLCSAISSLLILYQNIGLTVSFLVPLPATKVLSSRNL
jgi:uncharacterized MnhB-related membrane protein